MDTSLNPFIFALIVGFFGSWHCAGMCGPLVLSLPHGNTTLGKDAIGQLVYHLGRVAVYMVFGAAAGLFGQALVFASLQKWVSLLTGFAIVFFAAQSISGFSLTRRSGKSTSAINTRIAGWFKQWYGRSRFMAGAINGLLPCGFVYVGVAGALNQFTIPDSALYMAAFGAGTIPMMLLIGLSPRLIPGQTRLRMARFIPYGALVLGFLFILRGMELNIPFLSPVLKAMSCH